MLQVNAEREDGTDGGAKTTINAVKVVRRKIYF